MFNYLKMKKTEKVLIFYYKKEVNYNTEKAPKLIQKV